MQVMIGSRKGKRWTRRWYREICTNGHHVLCNSRRPIMNFLVGKREKLASRQRDVFSTFLTHELSSEIISFIIYYQHLDRYSFLHQSQTLPQNFHPKGPSSKILKICITSILNRRYAALTQGQR